MILEASRFVGVQITRKTGHHDIDITEPLNAEVILQGAIHPVLEFGTYLREAVAGDKPDSHVDDQVPPPELDARIAPADARHGLTGASRHFGDGSPGHPNVSALAVKSFDRTGLPTKEQPKDEDQEHHPEADREVWGSRKIGEQFGRFIN